MYMYYLQVLVRNWRARYDSKMAVSAITAGIHIFLMDPTYLQFDRKEGISNNTRLQHPQQKPKTPSVKTQNKHVHRRKRGKEHEITPQNIQHKRLHINQRDQWAIGADLGRPSATKAAEGVVIRITCAQPSHFSDYPEVSKNAQ